MKRYHKLLNRGEKKYNKLFDEFQEFNSMGEYEIDLSDTILTTYDDGTNCYRMVIEIKSSLGNNNLCEVAKIV